MATKHRNLSTHNPNEIPDASKLSIGIVVAEWNSDITDNLLNGALDTLMKYGVSEDNIIIDYVPGTFELTYAAKIQAECYDIDAVICLGCVIQGETRHFDFICHGVTQGITELNVFYDIPFIFGILTTENLQQAQDRAGGKYGNKGVEAALTAIKMAFLNNNFFE